MITNLLVGEFYMNRVFKRLTQGGIFNSPDTMIKFTFEGKTYTALEGDTIKMALLVNNITNHHRSVAGHFLSSSMGLSPVVTDITDNFLNHYRVATHDFKMTHGLKLSQTNKPNFASRLRSFVKFFKTSTGIHPAVIPITAKDITDSLINKDIVTSDVMKFTEKMDFDTEKSYIHTDIAVIGTNIFALQAALILADSGLRVTICHDYSDIAYCIFRDSDLRSLYNDLKNRTQNHPNITFFKEIKTLSVVCDNVGKPSQIMGIQHQYGFDISATHTKKQNNAVALSVINAKHIVYAPALKEMGFLFQGHHLPNIMGCREFMELHLKFGLVVHHNNIILYLANDMAYDILSTTGINPDTISAIIDIRPTMTQTMIDAEKRGFKIYAGYVVTHATGKDCVQSVTFKSLRGDKDAVTKTVSCSALICSAGYGLDISLLDNLPQAVDITVSDDYKIAVTPKQEFLSQHHISLCGYALYNTDMPLENKQSVVDCVKKIIENLGIKTEISENPQIAQMLEQLQWSYPEFYDAHDLCRKEAVLFPQDIHYNDFIQILYRYDNPLNAIEALGQSHNFYGNHRAICILMIQIQKIYNLSPTDIKQFYHDILTTLNKQICLISPRQILETLSTCGQPKPHILPTLDTQKLDLNNQIITPDCKMSASDIDKYFHIIKNHAGIRAFNNPDIVDISGTGAFDLIQKTLKAYNHTLDFPVLNVGEHFIVSEKQTQNPTLIFYYAPNRYCVIFPAVSECKKICTNLYENNTPPPNSVMNNVTQGWAYLQMIGNDARHIFEKITKQPTPQNSCELWIENIQLRFIIHNRFGVPHVDMLIVSDAAEAFYQKLTQQIAQLVPFGDNIYNMFALEAGAIFDMCSVHSTHSQTEEPQVNFKTPALAIPLVKLDKPLVGGDIFPDKNHLSEIPLGITFPMMIYSPFYNQYVFPTLLKGDLQEWENKIVSVMTKDGQETAQVKIISDKMSKIQEVA